MIYIKKLFLILFLALILICTLEYAAYIKESKNYQESRHLNKRPQPNYDINIQTSGYNLQEYDCDGSNNCFLKIRQPEGTEFKNKEPLVIFGCSFAHGTRSLNHNQTLGYKLAQYLKRPVYNRSVIGGGLAQMYYQTTNDYFYKVVPSSPDIIYVMIFDQYRRVMINKFEPADHSLMLHYKYNKKTKKLTFDKPSLLYAILNNSYMLNSLKNLYSYRYINNPKNSEILTDMALTYFLESRKELEKHWNRKINFTVILYDHIKIRHQNLLKQKLEDNGFKVIITSEITKENLDESKYKLEDGAHPNPAAWDLLIPLIVKNANL